MDPGRSCHCEIPSGSRITTSKRSHRSGPSRFRVVSLVLPPAFPELRREEGLWVRDYNDFKVSLTPPSILTHSLTPDTSLGSHISNLPLRCSSYNLKRPGSKVNDS